MQKTVFFFRYLHFSVPPKPFKSLTYFKFRTDNSKLTPTTTGRILYRIQRNSKKLDRIRENISSTEQKALTSLQKDKTKL